MGFLNTMLKVYQAFESPEKKEARLKAEAQELINEEKKLILQERLLRLKEQELKNQLLKARTEQEPQQLNQMKIKSKGKKNNTDDDKNNKKYESEKEEEPEKDPKQEFVESTAFKSIRKEEDGTYSWNNKAVGRRTELQGRKLDMYKEHTAEQKAQQQSKAASVSASAGAETSGPEL